jgi:hypothetical protein
MFSGDTLSAQDWECDISGFYQSVDTPKRSIVFSMETGWNYASKILISYSPKSEGVFEGPIEVINRFLVYLPEKRSMRELYIEFERDCLELLVEPIDSAVIVIDLDGRSYLKGSVAK